MDSVDGYGTRRDGIRAPHAPPDACREEMWQVVSRAWSEQAIRRRRRRRTRGWAGAGLTSLGMLALGIFVGRAWNDGSEHATPRLAEPRSAEPLSAPYRLAVEEHFEAAETVLALFSSESRVDSELSRRARELAATTRLLMNSPAGDDAQVRSLLLDLELLLVQIARLADEPNATESQLARESVERSNVPARLRLVTQESPEASGVDRFEEGSAGG